MYRFLMVDDEDLVRRGFESKIDRPASGFEFLPPSRNGREAIAAIDELVPDVVMTDIRMPQADGLAVAAHVAEKHPETVVVVLSGFDDFAYAQAAIRNGVYDYVLKPVSSRDLSALLSRLRAKLDADRLSRAAESELRERAGLGDGAIRERVLASFIGDGSGAPSAARIAGILGFDPAGLSCAAVVAERDSPGAADPESGIDSAKSVLRRFKRCPAFSPRPGLIAALAFEADPARCRAAALSAASALLDGGRTGLRVGSGAASPEWRDAPRSYAEARASLAYRLVRAPDRPFEYFEGEEGRDGIERLRSDEERLRLGVRSGAADDVARRADAYLASAIAAGLSPRRLRHGVIERFARLHDDLSAIGMTSQALSAALGCDYYRFAEGLERREDLVAARERLAESADGELKSARLRGPEWKILDFKDFISRRYAEPGLSIGIVAERLYISESYLSKLIRRMLGTSFVDYLAEYRVERAKELLASSDMMGYEVAEVVGYADARYFGALFKRRTGVTPSEYRKTLRADGPGAG